MSDLSAIVSALNSATPPARSQLQEWAKQHGVKANLSSAAIVTQLKAKLSTPAPAPATSDDEPAETVGSKRKAAPAAAAPAAVVEEEPAPAKKQKGKPKAKSGKQEAADNLAADSEMAPAAASDHDEKSGASASSSAAAAPAPAKRSGPVFAGMTFCLTGDFTTGKTGLEGLIERNGGRVVSSVSKTLTYLVCGKAAAGPFGGKSGPGSSKCKEARKLKKPVVNEEFILKAVSDATPKNTAAGHPALPSISEFLPTVIGELVVQYLMPHHEILELWESITFLLTPKERAGLPAPATDAEIDKAEQEMKLGIPEDIRLILRYGANGFGYGLPGNLSLSSTEEMLEQFGYGSSSCEMYRTLGWLPIGQIDYDFCWRALDLKSGKLLYMDLECNNFKVEAPSFRHSLESYHAALLKYKGRLTQPDVDSKPKDEEFENAMRKAYCVNQHDLRMGDYGLWNKFNNLTRRLWR